MSAKQPDHIAAEPAAVPPPDEKQQMVAPAASASDAEKPTITVLPVELILNILEWVGPRTVKRFGQTCREYREIARYYESTSDYATSLVRYALARFAAILVETHTRCCEGGPALLLAKAETYAQHVAATLAGCPVKPLADWKKVECLRLLYPVATGLPYWPFAPYALEWCARHERDLLGVSKLGPRHELLALLSPDALERLAVMAAEIEWGPGKTYAVTAAAACSTVTPETLTVVRDVVNCLAASAISSACRCRGPGGRVTFAVAMMAATTTRLSGWSPDMDGPRARPLMKDRLSGLRAAAGALRESKLPEEDRAWLDLAGLGERSPGKLLNEFDCRSGEPRPPQRGNAFAQLAFLMALVGGQDGPPVIVPVPDALLGAMLAHAHGGGDDDDMPDLEPAGAERRARE